MLVVIVGKGRVFKCLQENLAQTNFGEACKAEVSKRESFMQEDYRLDYGVSSQCEADVEAKCAAEKVGPGDAQSLQRETQTWDQMLRSL